MVKSSGNTQIAPEYKRIFTLAAIMSTIVMAVVTLTLYFMYQTAMSETKSRLVETAQSQARFFESVIDYDARHGQTHGHTSLETFEISLGQFKDAHARYKGFGETGEFTLATQKSSEIVFLLRHRHYDLNHPKPVAMDTKLAEPMRRALSGQSGTVVGLDYRGEMVVAAHEPVSGPIPLGIVAKIDLDEVQRPFIVTGLFMLALAAVLVLPGVYLFYRISQPIIDTIRRNEAKFKNLAEMSSVAIYMADEKGAVAYANPLWREHTGLDGEGMEKKWQQRVHPDDRQQVLDEWKRVMDDQGTWEQEYRFVNPATGQITWVHGLLRKIQDPYRNTHGYVGVNIDITKQKEAEEQLRIEMRKRMEQERLIVQQGKMAEIGNMVAAVGHQWKQPLNVISLISDGIPDMLVHGDEADKEIEQYCEQISDQVQFMAQTMDDFRNFFRPSMEKTDFAAHEVMSKVGEMFKNQFEKSGVEIIIHPHECFRISGYESEFMQVILNLFSNARDAIEEKGARRGRIDCFFSQDNGWATIRIQDNGGGIAETLLPDKLFELHASTKGESGTGIGLQISKSIIETHMSGKLWAQNVPEGAEFVIELPLAESYQQVA